jgi:hypothetical protein
MKRAFRPARDHCRRSDSFAEPRLERLDLDGRFFEAAIAARAAVVQWCKERHKEVTDVPASPRASFREHA